MRVAVVGAGIVGLSAARFLGRRGHRTVLFEQYALPHARGSSHGESRIVRRAYPDPFYTACMAEAYPMWRELESESGEHLLHEVGLLFFGSATAPDLNGVRQGLADLDVDHRVLEPRDVSTVFPTLRLEPGEVGIFTPEAGWVQADRALQATLRLAQATGTEIRIEDADPFQLVDQFDAVVLTPGPWIRRWIDLPVVVTQMTFGYLQTPTEGPVWIEDGPSWLYGFPSTDRGTKVGVHAPGIPVDPDQPERTPDPDDLERIRDWGRRRLGVEVEVVHPGACLYTTAPNEDFRLGRFAPNGFYASACSGHGFKFGPWIGRLLADFVEGRDTPERHPRFSIE